MEGHGGWSGGGGGGLNRPESRRGCGDCEIDITR